MLLFGAAYAAPNKGTAIYYDLGLYQLCQVLQKIVEFKDFSRRLSDFPVLFKTDLIFKDFAKKSSKFKYFSSLCEPCLTENCLDINTNKRNHLWGMKLVD